MVSSNALSSKRVSSVEGTSRPSKKKSSHLSSQSVVGERHKMEGKRLLPIEQDDELITAINQLTDRTIDNTSKL